MKLPSVPTRSRSRLAVLSTAAITLFGCLSGAGAAMIASDDFNGYSTGGLSGNNGGSGWSNAYSVASGTVNVIAGGLSYSNGTININGGSQSVGVLGNSNNNSLITRQFPSQSGSELWFSFLFRPTTGAGGDDFLQFWIGANSNVNGSGATVYNSGILSNRITSAAANTTNGASTIPGASGTTYFLVGRFSTAGALSAINYDRLELWVNPASTSAFSGAADVTADRDTGISGGISWFGLRTANLDVSDDYRFDELRIGTDALSVVPEPNAGVLMLCGFAGLIALRRRHARI